MRSFWSDPYLWIHLAGLATVPIWLELCLLGLAVGDPALPVWLELALVGGVGVAPIAWMQWQRPFSIFSLVALALKPERLSDDQRKLLTLFKSRRNQVGAIVLATLLLLVLQKLYLLAPIASSLAPFSPDARLLGLGLAAIAFLGANLFVQVPVSVLSVMLTSESDFAATLPYPTEQIRQSFTLLGLPVNQILPPMVVEERLEPVTGAVARITPQSISDSAPLAKADDTIAGDTIADPWLTTTAPAPTQPANQPDLTGVDVQTEEVKTEKVQPEIDPDSFTVSSELATPTDLESETPPNSL